MAIDKSDNIFVTDVNQKVILMYDALGNFLESFDPGCEPLSIAINKNNQVFFGDGETGTIYRLDPDETKTEFYSGTQYPNSMVFDANGLLYVVDRDFKKAIVLDLSANVVRNLGEGTFLFIMGIAFNQIVKNFLVMAG